MRETNNLHVVDTMPLIGPDALKSELPISDRAADFVFAARERIKSIIHGNDRRILAIVGPCSIHDPDAAVEYAHRLQGLAERFSDELLVCMRVYFEKPRTTVGWKGLINDPHLDGSYDVPTGLRQARGLLLELAEAGIPAATEMLDPIIPQYLADLVSWTAIGARTTESQTHREMASGLSMPVGFKNGTDGSLQVAINAMLSSASPHRFLGIDGEGRVVMVQTSGNPDTHAVLRGGNAGPNYSTEKVATAVDDLRRAGVQSRMLVDCSHDNSGKNHERQPQVLGEVADQLAQGSQDLLGVMVESNLVAGKQKLQADKPLVRGQSITDACVDLEVTERMLQSLATAQRRRDLSATA